MLLPSISLNPWKFTVDGYIYRQDGYVGIGTTTPTEKLDVDGFVRASYPVLPEHLTTKAYVDNLIGGLDEELIKDFLEEAEAIQTILKDLDGYAQNSTVQENKQAQYQVNQTLIQALDGYAFLTIEDQRWIDSSEQLQDLRNASDGYNDQALEDISIILDPTSGTDPIIGMRYNTQAQITSHGSFATINGILNSLPPIVQNITITIVDGVYTWTSLGDWSKFTIPDGKQILLQSSSIFTRELGTSTYIVSSTTSTTSTTIVNLTADPGFVTDTYKNKWMRIVSGTGSGQYLPIRTHTATAWTVAGQWNDNPDGTSVMEIVNPSASITLTPVITQVNGPGLNDIATGISPMQWKGIEFIGSSLQMVGCDIILEAFKRTNGSIVGRFCYFQVSNIISTGGTIGFLVNGGRIQTFVASTTSANGMLISSKSNVGISIGAISAAYTATIPAKGYLARVSTDSFTGSGIPYKITGGGSVLSLSTIKFAGTSPGNRIFQIDLGGVLQLDANTASGGNYPVGAIADILIDGQDVSYGDLLSEPNKVLIGEQNSIARIQTGL